MYFKSLTLSSVTFLSLRKGTVWMEALPHKGPGGLRFPGSLGRRSSKMPLTRRTLTGVGVLARPRETQALLKAARKMTEASRRCGPQCLSIM